MSELAESHRKKLHCSQESMAEKLHISSRSYNDIKQKRYAFSTPVLLFLITYMSADELLEFQEKIKLLVERLEQAEEIEL